MRDVGGDRAEPGRGPPSERRRHHQSALAPPLAPVGMEATSTTAGADAQPSPTRRDDPSRATRAEIAARCAESVALVGNLAKLMGKAASSPALQSTVTSFAEYETTIESTHEMLQKVQRGLEDLEEQLDECAASMRVTSDGGANT